MLAKLLEATGTPPPPDHSPDKVLQEAKVMVDRRATIVEALAAMGPVEDPKTLEPTWSSLRTREEAWANRIAKAREDIEHYLGSVRRMKRRRTLRPSAVALRRRV